MSTKPWVQNIEAIRKSKIAGCNRLAGCERVLKRDRVSSPFAKPLITAGTGRWSIWSLLWLWLPAFPVPGPAQLADGARCPEFQWPPEWRYVCWTADSICPSCCWLHYYYYCQSRIQYTCTDM